MKKIFSNLLSSAGWSLVAGIMTIAGLILVRMVTLVVISHIQGNYYEGVTIYTPTPLNQNIFYGGVMLTVAIMIFVLDHSWQRLVKNKKTKTA